MNEAAKKLLVEKAAKFGLTIDATTDYTKLQSQIEELEVKAEISTVVKEGIQPTVELVQKMDARMTKLEAAAAAVPAREADRTKNVYKGFKVHKQFGMFRDQLMKGEQKNYCEGGLKSEESQDDYVKNMIDIIIAGRGDSSRNMSASVMEAKGALEARKQKAMDAGIIAKTSQLQDGSNTSGGYLIEPDYQWDIIKLARNRSYALQLCRIVNMASLNQYFPQESTLGNVIWQPEGAVVTPNEPTFNQLQLIANKAMCFVRVTNEQLADNMVDLVSMLTEQFAYALGQELDNQVFNGSGTPWSGLFSSITQSVVFAAGASISTLTFTNLSYMISQLLQGRLEGAAWVMSRTMLHYVRSLKDTYGRPVFAMPGNGVPGTIYEYPYYLSEKISNIDGASAEQLLFGNFQYALLGRRQGVMTVDADPYGMFDSDITRFRQVTRWGFGIGDKNAFVIGKAASS